MLDSNVFTACHFDRLYNSPIKRLQNAGRVDLVYSAVMLEETLRAHARPSTRKDLVDRWLPFILDTAPRLGDEITSIWQKELIQGDRSEAAFYMSRDKYDSTVAELQTISAHSDWPVLKAAEKDIHNDDLLKKARRAKSLAMREEARKKAEEAGVPKLGRENVGAVIERSTPLMEHIGPDLIERFVSPENWRDVSTRWASNKVAYPFFTEFVRNEVFREILFMTDHSVRVDSNAQADLDILTCLLHADALVTNETAFMRTAFDHLWRPRGKVIFTSAEFAEFLSRL